MGLFPMGNSCRFPRGKPAATESRYTALLNYYSVCSIFFSVTIPPAVRPTLLRQMDMGSITCAHNLGACRAHEREVMHKQVCTKRVGSERQKKMSLTIAPGTDSKPGSCGVNADALVTERRLPGHDYCSPCDHQTRLRRRTFWRMEYRFLTAARVALQEECRDDLGTSQDWTTVRIAS